MKPQPVLVGLFADPSADPRPGGREGQRKAGFVPASSVQAYARLQRKNVRAIHATDLIVAYQTALGHSPTSRELAQRYFDGSTDCRLYVRRGLSDALAKGLVEHAGKRDCTVAGTLAVTWRVRSR